jgi:subtilisin
MSDAEDEDLPAYSLTASEVRPVALPSTWPREMTRDWAWGDSQGDGVRVAIVDSGVDAGHPFVGGALELAVAAHADEDGEVAIVDDDQGDASGHGTACAGIIHRVAPQARLTSVRVLGAEITGAGDALLGGLRWAIDERYPIINLSLSTSKSRFVAALHDLADRAYFASCLLIASAHNMPVSSYPWRFSSVLSVASHAGHDPLEYFYNPDPPVEFHAPGVDLEVAWSGGSVIRASGNSFATPNMAGLAARVLGRHPGLTPFQVKTVLHLAATNVGGHR